MSSLAQLLGSTAGQRILGDHAIHVNSEDFVAALKPPRDPSLEAGRGRLPVYVHQQPSPDFAPSVVAKFRLLHDLAQAGEGLVEPCFVAIDTDRAASSKSPTRIAWHRGGKLDRTDRLISPRAKYMEFRNMPVDRARLEDCWQHLCVRAQVSNSPAQRGRLAAVAPHFSPPGTASYGAFACGLGSFLLQGSLGKAPRLLTVSQLQTLTAVTAAIRRLLSCRKAFIAAYNRKLSALHAIGIDPPLRALPTDYLPFFYSCPVDGERLRLAVTADGSACAAEATSRAGRSYRFSLGDGTAIDALMATGRVSVDILLPVFLATLFSGLVVGRSSALYCMVMASAIEESLGEGLCPMLVPASLAGEFKDPRGLFQRWFEGDSM